MKRSPDGSRSTRRPATRPPATLAERVLRGAVPRDAVVRSILGDLHEEYVRRLRSSRPGHARAWYLWQACRIAVGYRRGGHRGNEIGPMGGAGVRRLRAPNYLDDLRQDLRFTVRGMWLNPGFTAVVVATLGLGIGANAAMFGLVDRLLLSAPPHLRNPDAIVRIGYEVQNPNGGRFLATTTSYPVFTDLSAAGAFTAVAGVRRAEVVVGRGTNARALPGALVTGGYFELLGVEPELGRFLGATDDRLPRGEPVLVVGYQYWQRELGGRAEALGSSLVLDGTEATVVGVAPRGFTGDSLAPVDLWIPYSAGMAAESPGWPVDRRRLALEVLARLAAEDSPEISRQIATAAYQSGQAGMVPAGMAAAEIRLTGLVAGIGGDGPTPQGRIALWLNGVALVVLLTASANVTNLLVVRGLKRRYEIAVRSALGMTRRRLVRQLLTESLVLAGLGGLFGLLVAAWGGNLARTVLLPELAAGAGVIDRSVLIASATAAVVVGLVAGLVPILHSGIAAAAAGLRLGTGPAGTRLRSALLVVQTGLSVLLLFGAGVFVASLYRVERQDLGFAAHRVLLATPEFVQGVDPETHARLFTDGVAALVRVPDVELAVSVTTVPFGPRIAVPLNIPGLPDDLFEGRQFPYLNPVAPDHFELMGMRMLEGRPILPSDGRETPPVVVLDSHMARSLWPGETAVGKCIRLVISFAPPSSILGGSGADGPCREVVGVVATARRRSIRPEDTSVMQYYLPTAQLAIDAPGFGPGGPQAWGWLARVAGRPDASAAAVRRALQSISPQIRFVDVRPFETLIDPQVRPFRLGATMFTLFGGLALAMAAIGLYGALAYSIGQRTRELGVRMALGATAARVVRLVTREALTTTAIGGACGSIAAMALSPRLAPLLFETDPRSLPVLMAVLVILLLVAWLASVLPARQATRTDASVALAAD